jgi:hypothetical protein
MKVAAYVFQAIAMVFCVAILFSPHQPGPMVTHPVTTIALAVAATVIIWFAMRQVYTSVEKAANFLDKRNPRFGVGTVLFMLCAAALLYMTPAAILWLLSFAAAPIIVAHDTLWMAGFGLMMVDMLLGEITGQRVIFPAPKPRNCDNDEVDGEDNAPKP